MLSMLILSKRQREICPHAAEEHSLAPTLKALIHHLITSLLCSCAYFYILVSRFLSVQSACTFTHARLHLFVHLMREQPADRFYYLHVNVSSAESTAAIHHIKISTFPQQASVPQMLHAAKLTPLYTPADPLQKHRALISSAEGDDYLNDDEAESGPVGAQSRSQRSLS